MRLQKRRKLHIVENRVPIQRKLQVPERLRIGHRRKVLVRQQHRPRHRHAQLLRQRVVEELVVRRPPERIVDHLRPRQHRILQIRPVERHVVRDPVHDHRIRARLRHLHAAHLHKLRRNPIHLHRVDLLDQRTRKRVLHAQTKRQSSSSPTPRHLASYDHLLPTHLTDTPAPSAATTASHARYCRPRHPAAPGFPFRISRASRSLSFQHWSCTPVASTYVLLPHPVQVPGIAQVRQILQRLLKYTSSS